MAIAWTELGTAVKEIGRSIIGIHGELSIILVLLPLVQMMLMPIITHVTLQITLRLLDGAEWHF